MLNFGKKADDAGRSMSRHINLQHGFISLISCELCRIVTIIISVCDREKARSTRESLRIARPLLLSGMKRYRFQSRGKIRPDVSVVLQDVGFPFSHSYSSQREWQRWREGAKSGGEMVEVVERENVGITFGRRIMFMLPSSC